MQDQIRRLVNHPYATSMAFVGSGKRASFTWQPPGSDAARVRLMGVRPLLKRHLFAHYRLVRHSSDLSTGVGSSSEGKRRGIRVHKQLEWWCKHGVESMKRRWPGKKAEPLAKKFIKFAQHHRVVPGCAELRVCDPAHRLGSAIDAVLVDPEDRLVMIDYKCGSDSTFLRHTRVIKHSPLGQCPGTPFTDSPKDQGLAQLLVYRYLLTRVYGASIGFTDADGTYHSNCYVVQLPHNGPPRAFPLSKEQVDVQDAFFRWLVGAEADRRALQQARADKRRIDRLRATPSPPASGSGSGAAPRTHARGRGQAKSRAAHRAVLSRMRPTNQ